MSPDPPPEAPLVPTENGLVPGSEGWFIVNAREARWYDGPCGPYVNFQGDFRFEQFGIGIGVIYPGQVSPKYHRESEQEDFLVLSGECLVVIEEQERPLKAWDLVHCPPWTAHVFVGAGDGPCAYLAVGARPMRDCVFPVSEAAAKYGGSVAFETKLGEEAYAGLDPYVPASYRDEWLPG